MNSIELKNVTKTYRIYKKPVYRIVDALFNTKNYEEHKALKDITINIEEGEAVGVLGKNGAGKSTLLKILTGVAEPTSGEVKVNGKIAAILELNSGFDEELTGRENIDLKCTILGYTKEEIKDSINNIIQFADIGKYIDQPVRTYSSGMKARLGFAIAVNSNPDVLIVDEALSVGDDIFRTKCLAKMSEFRKAGKTIFFVSHSIYTIKSFCTKCAWIKDGMLVDYGDMGDVVQKYETFLKEEKAKEKSIKKLQNKDEAVDREDYIATWNLAFNKADGNYNFKENIEYSFEYIVRKPLEGLRWTLTIRDADEKEIYSSNKLGDEYLIDNSIGKHKLNIRLKDLALMPGKYMLSGELRDETGIIYNGYANKKQFTVIGNGDYIGNGIQYISHERIN